MHALLHSHTIAILEQYVWADPEKNTIGKFISLQYEGFPSGQALIDLLNLRMSQREPIGNYYVVGSDITRFPDLSLIDELRKQFRSHIDIQFKNTYQFAAFLAIWDSKCKRKEVDEVLRMLKPPFLAVEMEPRDEYTREDPAKPLNTHVIVDVAPDYVLRSHVLRISDNTYTFFGREDYINTAVLLMEYFLEDPLDQLPDDIKLRCFDESVVAMLSEKYPDHPKIREWILDAYEKDYFHAFGPGSAFLNYLPLADQQDPVLVKKIVSKNPKEFKRAQAAFLADKEIVRIAVAQRGTLIEWASPELQYDPDLIFLAAMQEPRIIPNLLAEGVNSSFLSQCLRIVLLHQPKYIRKLVDSIAVDFPELIDFFSLQSPPFIKYASENVKASHKLALDTLEKDPRQLQHFNKNIRSDKNLIMMALKNNGLAIEFVNKKLRYDPEMIEAALTSSPQCFVYLPKDLCPSREQALRWTKIQPLIYRYLQLNYRWPNDPELQHAYIAGILKMKNSSILSIPVVDQSDEDID